MNFKIAKLQLRRMTTQIRDGTVSANLLWGMFVSWFDRMYGQPETDRLIGEYRAGNPPLRISAGFLFCGDALLLPLPKGYGAGAPLASLKAIQMGLKEVARVQLGICEAWVAPNEMRNFMGGKKIAISDRPRIMSGPDGGGKLWRQTEVSFAENCGLWFLVECESDATVEQVGDTWSAISAVSGLGSNVTDGYGQFRFAGLGEIDLAIPQNGKVMSLSATLAPEGEANAVKYQGFSHGAEQANGAVAIWPEASVFPTDKAPQGGITKVGEKDGHDVLFYGLPFYIPLPELPQTPVVTTAIPKEERPMYRQPKTPFGAARKGAPVTTPAKTPAKYPAPAGFQIGTVAFFNAENRFGFIKPLERGDDIHFRESVVEGRDPIEKGDRVEYKAKRDARGWSATVVRKAR